MSPRASDGSYGTLETKPLYEWKMALGAAYRAELAEELRAHGYEIAPDVKGSIRIKECRVTSSVTSPSAACRSRAAMAERGTTSAKAAEACRARHAQGEGSRRARRRCARAGARKRKTLGVTAEHLDRVARDTRPRTASRSTPRP